MRQTESVLELLEIYSDMIENQIEMIRQLSEQLKKQAVEIQHLRTLNNLITPSENDDTMI